ncbi:AAA family ATPase [Thalassococcus sp. BH17M4-6]|uniref:AAA family ATPase n=1 Tax=Thalassococcus sp. BH17M4-6 TaxID=3413148 RepID=UPI003BDCBDE0
MTYAYSDIERASHDHVADPAERMQIGVVAADDAMLARMTKTMQDDATVAVQPIPGTLAQLLLGGDADWPSLDFLVFHADPDDASVLAAVHCLLSKPDVRLHAIAMTDGAPDPAFKAQLQSAGVAEVLPVPQGSPPPPRVDTGPRLHLSLPDADPVIAAPAPVPAQEAPAATDKTEAPVPTGTGRITTVLRARGGAGASTVAVNLALELARTGQDGSRVALVDLDIQNGSVGVLLDLPDSPAVTALLRDGGTPDGAFLDGAMSRHSSGIDVLAAPDIFVPLTALTVPMLEALMDTLQTRYDHVIVDMPQAMLDWIEPVFERASQALIVTDTSVPAIKRSRRLIDVLNDEHMTLTVQVVVNKEKRPLLLSESQKEAAHLLGRRLDHWVPEDIAGARKALDAGVPIILGAPRSRPARAIAGLAKALFPAARSGAK